jgi:hypothetical protein
MRFIAKFATRVKKIAKRRIPGKDPLARTVRARSEKGSLALTPARETRFVASLASGSNYA